MPRLISDLSRTSAGQSHGAQSANVGREDVRRAIVERMHSAHTRPPPRLVESVLAISLTPAVVSSISALLEQGSGDHSSERVDE